MNECIFCNHPDLTVLETSLTYAVYDKYPVSDGHVLVIPKRHEADYFMLYDDEKTDLWRQVDQVKDLLDERFHTDGYNIGININSSAGQTIFHVHIHVIPRYNGDMDDPAGGVRGVIPWKMAYGKREKPDSTVP